MKRAAQRRARGRTTRHAAPQLRLGVVGARELVVDLFAGVGGTSEGLKSAIGRDPDIAIDHDPMAVAMHEANHMTTQHYCESVFKARPLDVCQGRPVGFLWLSPDCTHFSKSKGGKPRSKKLRGLAWVAVRWAHDVSPRVIVLENVEEFEGWGPLLENGLPDPSRAGKTFRAFVRKLESYGYHVEWRTLVAADFGVPTTRKRLFLIARRDGEPIVWPTPTHAKDGRGARRWRPAGDVIDWSLPCPSIFERKKPLAEPTLRRIAVGTQRYVIDAAQPFIVPVKTWGGGGNDPRSIELPHRTVTASKRGEFAVATPFVATYHGASVGRRMDEPLGTATSHDRFAVAVPFLVHRGNGEREGQTEVRVFLERFCPGIGEPLVTIGGELYVIVDIGMRMLSARDLFRAQGFPDAYVIDPIVTLYRHGKHVRERMPKTHQIAKCGNAVNPKLAEVICRANFQEIGAT